MYIIIYFLYNTIDNFYIYGNITIYNNPSQSEWLGMTYKEDLDIVKAKIKELKNKNEERLNP